MQLIEEALDRLVWGWWCKTPWVRCSVLISGFMVKSRLLFFVEELAFLSATKFARDLGFSRIIFEGDSLHVIRPLNHDS